MLTLVAQAADDAVRDERNHEHGRHEGRGRHADGRPHGYHTPEAPPQRRRQPQRDPDSEDEDRRVDDEEDRVADAGGEQGGDVLAVDEGLAETEEDSSRQADVRD